MLVGFTRGQGNIILRVKLKDTTTGLGKTGLTSASSGLKIAIAADNEATATAYTVAGSTIESITTLGTYAAPTATKCRFKEFDATNKPGIYEIQIADARFAVSSSKYVTITISGVSGVFDCDVCIPLTDVNPYDAVRMGMTALPNVASGSAGAIPTVGTGTAQINLSGGRADANVTYFGGSAGTFASGFPETNLKKILGTTLTETSTGYLAAAIKKFFDVATPVGTINSLPGADADTSGGLPVIGTGTRQINPNAGGIPLSFTGRQQVWDFLFSDMTLTAGSIGKLISDYLDAAVSSRLSSAGYTAPLDAPATRTALGLASANLDTQLGNIYGKVDTEIADIQARLPTSLTGGKMECNVGTITNGAIVDASFTVPSVSAGVPTGILGMIQSLFRRAFYKTTFDGSSLKTYANNGTTVLTTETITEAAGVQTKGAAS